MSHKSELTNIFDTSPCPSNETLMLYAQNKLGKDELRKVELHLAGCEMCTDVVEGFLVAGNSEVINSDVATINKLIDEKIKGNNVTVFSISRNTSFAIAAAVLLLIGIGFLFTHFVGETKKNEVASNSVPEIPKVSTYSTPKESESIRDEKELETPKNEIQQQRDVTLKQIDARQPNQSTPNTQASSEETTSSIPERITFESPATASKDAEDLAASDEEKAVSEQAATAGSTVIMDDKIFSVKTTASPSAQPKSIERAKGSAAKKNAYNVGSDATTENLASAKNDFMNSNYNEAKRKLEILHTIEPTNEEAIYFLAKSERMLKNYSASSLHFDKILLNKKSEFFEESEWQKALNLIDEKKNAEALKLLNKISSGKGKYAYPAAEMSSELGE